VTSLDQLVFHFNAEHTYLKSRSTCRHVLTTPLHLLHCSLLRQNFQCRLLLTSYLPAT